MINYTTPTITLTVEGVDLSEQEVFVSLEQNSVELTKTGNDLIISTETVGQVTTSTITFVLTQAESAAFAHSYAKPVNVQVNWINVSGVRDATEIKTIDVMRNLLDEVISYD